MPLTVAVIDGGITIVIENTLALGSDQYSKVNMISLSTSRRFIKAIHLHAIKMKDKQHVISNGIISHYKHNINTSIVIFTSPECLLKPI